jgi:signal transduction histidine kinase
MRNVAEWIRGTLESRREANRPPLGNVVLGMVSHNDTVERANHGLHVVTHSAEWFMDDDGAPTPVLEDERSAASLFVGSTTEPSPGAARLVSEPEFSRPPLAGRTRVPDSIVRDITPHTRALRQAQVRVEELATANRRKDEFLAMLSHELRSPLGAIRNAIRLLSSQTGDTPVRHRAQTLIERQVGRMTQLVDDLLDLSRISHGRLHVQRERIDLRVVVSHAIETLESDFNERRHRPTTALPDTPMWLQADSGRLEQVFVNLLANASRYTDTGGELAVQMYTLDGEAVVRVRDSGIGIAPEVLRHIFDLFRQADEAALRCPSGLGIGLALVRNLVELHGGSVTATSAGLGQGSEFIVRLPTAEYSR